MSTGDIDGAVDYWEDSAALDGASSICADYALAAWDFQNGEVKKAISRLAVIGDDTFFAAQKYELLGDILVRIGDLPAAIGAYRRSLQVNSGQRRVRANLVRLLRQGNPVQARIENERLRYIRSFYEKVGISTPAD
jgi:predicted negative regulator of RcsB-dependent stress response